MSDEMSGWERVSDAPDERKLKARKRASAWYRANRERVLEREKLKYKERRTDSEWMKANSEKQGRKIKELRSQVLTKYGLRCVCCGETQFEFLTLDHVHGGGRQHRKDIAGTSVYTYWKWFIKNDYPEGFQVLCMNCNFAKGMYGVCPHEKEKLKDAKLCASP